MIKRELLPVDYCKVNTTTSLRMAEEMGLRYVWERPYLDTDQICQTYWDWQNRGLR